MESFPKDPLQLPSLAEKFAADFPIGVAVEPKVLREQELVIARHFQRLTAENAMKWGVICPVEHQYQFERADLIAEFARRHSMNMTGHTFVWHQMTPRWLFQQGSKAASQNDVTQRLRDHIFTLMERYADVVDNWDVVNEAVSNTSRAFWRDRAEDSEWYATFEGARFVALAFELAAEAAERYCPHVKLYYNDYRIEDVDKREKAITMIRKLRTAGVRIDGVGIQGHIDITWPSLTELGRAIDEFAAEDLLVKVSELDVSVYCQDDAPRKKYQEERQNSPELEEQVAQRYADVFAVFRDRASKLTSVTLWGLSDDHSWLNHWPVRRKNYPLLFDHLRRPKVAFGRLLSLPPPLQILAGATNWSSVSNVVIYTTKICAYCARAKDLLMKKGIAFSEVDVSEDDAKRDWLFKASGQRTVPQIFINDQSIGGFQELSALDRKGELDILLSERHLESGSGYPKSKPLP